MRGHDFTWITEVENRNAHDVLEYVAILPSKEIKPLLTMNAFAPANCQFQNLETVSPIQIDELKGAGKVCKAFHDLKSLRNNTSNPC